MEKTCGEKSSLSLLRMLPPLALVLTVLSLIQAHTAWAARRPKLEAPLPERRISLEQEINQFLSQYRLKIHPIKRKDDGGAEDYSLYQYQMTFKNCRLLMHGQKDPRNRHSPTLDFETDLREAGIMVKKKNASTMQLSTPDFKFDIQLRDAIRPNVIVDDEEETGRFKALMARADRGCNKNPAAPREEDRRPEVPSDCLEDGPCRKRKEADLNVFITNEWEKDVFHIINRYRKQHGLKPLIYSRKLSAIARSHSEYLARNRMGANHNNINSRYRRMAKAMPWLAAGENVAYNMGFDHPSEQAFVQWKHSPGHNRLMLKSWSSLGGEGHTGIGVKKTADGRYYFTQVFAERAERPGPATESDDEESPPMPRQRARPFRWLRNLFTRH